jgi:peptide/nickel transport system permease protein
MVGFISRRLLTAGLTLLASSFIVFVLVANAGDPLADIRQQPGVRPEVVEARRLELRLDQPVVARYASWLTSAARGDLGTSLSGMEVRPLVWSRLQVTLRMVTAALVVAVALTLLIGTVSAARAYSRLDHGVTALMLVALSLPAFWVGAVLKQYVAIPVNDFFGHQVLYTIGAASPNLSGSLFSRWGDYLGHLVLPTAALALLLVSVWTRYLRAGVIEVLSLDYVRAARAKGASPARVLLRHALPNAAVPLSAVVAADCGSILGGAVVLERVFAWQGMGDLLVRGVSDADTNVVLAWLVVAASIVILSNLVADVVAGWLNPRIRHG